MSAYLWHVPAIILLTGIQLLWHPMPDPGTGAWWLTCPVFVVAVALFVVQSLAISSYGLDLPMAILGLVCTTIAVNLAEDSATARSRISDGNEATIAEGNPPTPDRRAGPRVPPR
ncbi:hypothetical protein [Brevibacterium sp. JSBI002]|uniref:hypothetical protein n=1 Tax=Brevibacterium sp. JSBI002 TaxID=2886045 RepID=UPI002230CAD1|nr:hypothetical protein [Brevibacterium sp. JSBI002]UZD63133.1 hypothetical protein LJ362_04605 [Brevibacterium sp. JSBI002]